MRWDCPNTKPPMMRVRQPFAWTPTRMDNEECVWLERYVTLEAKHYGFRQQDQDPLAPDLPTLVPHWSAKTGYNSVHSYPRGTSEAVKLLEAKGDIE